MAHGVESGTPYDAVPALSLPLARSARRAAWRLAMLDAFVIFTRGGVVLFSEQLVALRGEPVEALVRECLLTERAGGAAFNYATDGAAYALKWAFHNEKGLVFVAVRRDSALPGCVLRLSLRGTRRCTSACWR